MLELNVSNLLKENLEPYISPILGPYLYIGVLIIAGILIAIVHYFIPSKSKPNFILYASLAFILISLEISIFFAFLALMFLFYICSNYKFKLRNYLFLVLEVFLILSPMIYYRLFGYFSAVYAFASYYTVYRTIHYFVDAYQGSLEKIKFSSYLKFIFFFPLFSNGPIQRIENLTQEEINSKKIAYGLNRILIGTLKIWLAVYVLSFFNEVPFSAGNFWSWLLVTAYLGAIKIYLIFSANIDIVIGISRLMGYTISENFPKIPYLQTSLTKFWQNWQATIVNWLTAYVYFPLCRNRRHIYLKTMVIIMIIGWAHLFYTPSIVKFRDFGHLADFVIYYTLWGVFLGGALAISKIFDKKKMENKQHIRSRYPFLHKLFYENNWYSNAIAIFITFNIISIGWQSPLYVLFSLLR